MFLQNYVQWNISKISTNTQAWRLQPLALSVYTVSQTNPYLRQIKEKLLDTSFCILSRQTRVEKNKSMEVLRWSQCKTMWSQTEATTYLALCRTFGPFFSHVLTRAKKSRKDTLCSLYGLCPSISEYLYSTEGNKSRFQVYADAKAPLKINNHFSFNWRTHNINNNKKNCSLTMFHKAILGELEFCDTEMKKKNKQKLHLYRSSLWT